MAASVLNYGAISPALSFIFRLFPYHMETLYSWKFSQLIPLTMIFICVIYKYLEQTSFSTEVLCSYLLIFISFNMYAYISSIWTKYNPHSLTANSPLTSNNYSFSQILITFFICLFWFCYCFVYLLLENIIHERTISCHCIYIICFSIAVL